MEKITAFLKDTRSEMKQMKWPTKSQTIAFTVLVVAISIILAYFLGLFDLIFTKGVEKVLQ